MKLKQKADKKNNKIAENVEKSPSKQKRKRDENREMGVVTYSFLAIFIAMMVYLGFYTQFKSADLINNPYNKRQQLLEEHLVRGDILSRDGSILATTSLNEDGEYERVYPYGNAFAHVVGYSTHGVLGLESKENFKLLECNDNIFYKLKNDLSGEKNHGNNVYSTLDEKMQLAAYEALGDKKGAVIAMNAKTGEILAACSKPDFDPNLVNEAWEYLNDEANDSPLLNRVFMGNYAPGSTFKIVTALEYIKENGEYFREYDFDCTGSFSYKGSTINCYHGQSHGELDFNLSFAKSCNSSFANIASTLNKSSFEETGRELLFNSDLPLPLTYAKSSLDITADSTTDELLQTGIGQGKTLVSPAHMCLIAAAIANDGVLMKPYLVSRIESSRGGLVKRYTGGEYGRLMDSYSAEILKELMRDVVTDGTGSKLKDAQGYEAYGKTGSAEYMQADKSLSHAWFTGFAQDDKDTIAITVLVEGGGSGGDVAVPIAKSVFDAYFE